MELNKGYDLFIDELINNAVIAFKSTEQYDLLREKPDKMDCDCETMFTKEEQDFAGFWHSHFFTIIISKILAF